MLLVPYLPVTVSPVVWQSMSTAAPSATVPAELAPVLGAERTVSGAPEAACTVPVAARAGVAPASTIATAMPATPAARFPIRILICPSLRDSLWGQHGDRRYKARTNARARCEDAAKRTKPRRTTGGASPRGTQARYSAAARRLPKG